jgi:hypothetical protein
MPLAIAGAGAFICAAGIVLRRPAKNNPGEVGVAGGAICSTDFAPLRFLSRPQLKTRRHTVVR